MKFHLFTIIRQLYINAVTVKKPDHSCFLFHNYPNYILMLLNVQHFTVPCNGKGITNFQYFISLAKLPKLYIGLATNVTELPTYIWETNYHFVSQLQLCEPATTL